MKEDNNSPPESKTLDEELTSEYVTDASKAAADRKREQLDQAWKKKLQEREVQAAVRLAEKKKELDPNQDADRFNQNFKKLAQSVSDGLEAAKAKSTQGEGISRADLAETMNDLQTVVVKLQADLAAATLYLPPYDVRQCSDKIASLTQDISSARTSLAPRKKFAFKGKRTKVSETKTIVSNEKEEDDAPRAAEVLLAAVTLDANELVIAQKQGETLQISPKSPDQDVRIRDAIDCTITMKHQSGAVRFVGLKNCRVAIGPVAGSCFFEDCHHCTFHIASRQIRIHNSENCDFYLHVLSRPIFEHCSALRFAPYLLSYDGLQDQIAKAGLDAARASEMWHDVDDFRWLKQQQSPNWTILPEEERKAWEC